MFSLIAGLWRWFSQKEEMRFLIIGLDNAGKTTTQEQLKRLFGSRTPKMELDRIAPTVGLNLCDCELDRNTRGIFWDLGGQLMLRTIWENHYTECDGIVYVCDSCDYERFAEVKETIEKVLNHPSLRQRDIPIVLLANKQDDSHAIPAKAIIQRLGLAPCFTQHHNDVIPVPRLIPFCPVRRENQIDDETDVMARPIEPPPSNSPVKQSILHALCARGGPRLVCVSECSAKNGVNIKEAIQCLTQDVKRRRAHDGNQSTSGAVADDEKVRVA